MPRNLLISSLDSGPAVIFHFVVRGSLFPHPADFKQTSPFGFAALSAMVGMFSEQAVLKLKEMTKTLLAKPAKGKKCRSRQENR